MKINNINNVIEEVYLDYVNNYLTIPWFANHYDFSEEFAEAIIKEGRRQNQEKHRSK